MNQKTGRKNTMKFILKIISAGILLVMLTTLIAPASYLAWRAGQPMELPQFKGLTYYQYLHWRKIAYHELAVNYRAAHPNDKMGGGLDMCFHNDTGLTMGLGLPLTAFYTLAGVFPSLEKYVTPDDRSDIPQGTTLANFLPNWWLTFEKTVWYMAATEPEDSVSYCRLQPNVPTPEQLQAMDDHLEATAASQ